MNETRSTANKWAPWWAYVVPILGVNYLRQALSVGTDGTVVDVLLALSIAAVLFVAITAGYRLLRH